MDMREPLDEAELRELFSMNWKSSFEELFEGENMQLWNEFCMSSEEEQRSMLKKLNPEVKSHSKLSPSDDPKMLFNRLDRRVKTLLKKGVARDFVIEFEMALCKLLHPSKYMDMKDDNKEATLEVHTSSTGASVVLQDSMKRMLAHAICLFHSVQSFTRDSKETKGEKRLIMSWNREEFASSVHPRQLLHEYLEEIG